MRVFSISSRLQQEIEWTQSIDLGVNQGVQEFSYITTCQEPYTIAGYEQSCEFKRH